MDILLESIREFGVERHVYVRAVGDAYVERIETSHRLPTGPGTLDACLIPPVDMRARGCGGNEFVASSKHSQMQIADDRTPGFHVA